MHKNILAISLSLFLSSSAVFAVEDNADKKPSNMEVTPEQIWADQKCGGNAAFKKDEIKFEACVKAQLRQNQIAKERAKLKSEPKEVTADDIWTDQLCGGNKAFTQNEKKFNACKDAFKTCGFEKGIKLTKVRENCVAKAMVSHCPVYSPPLCGKDQHLGSILEEGCGTPVCVDTSDCPVFSAPLCGKNQEIAVIPTGNGCRKPICVEKGAGSTGGVK